jgi:hypothetical protein
MDGEAKRHRRWPAGGECGLKHFHFEAEKEREGNQLGTISVGERTEMGRHFVFLFHRTRERG